MYAFNRRLEAKTILGLPLKSAVGAFVIGGVVLAIVSFKNLWTLIFLLPFAVVGIALIRIGFSERGIEHLIAVLAEAKKDANRVDLGIGDE